MPLPKPVPLGELRAAIAACQVIAVWHQGDEIRIEPHALMTAQKTGALVVVGRAPSDDAGPWIFLRFALIRGLKVGEEVFERGRDVPDRVPLLTGRRDKAID